MKYHFKTSFVAFVAVLSVSVCQAETLVDLKLSLAKRFDWANDGVSPRPPSESGKFAIPGAGRASFTYSGSPRFDHQIFGAKYTFPGSADKLLPGRTVDSNEKERKNVVGQPFRLVWIQEFTADEKGMEVSCSIHPHADYKSATGATFPPQDASLEVEWLGDKTVIPPTPPTPPDTPGTPDYVDISGTWKHGPGGETWTFTSQGGGKYTTVEQGFGNARGTATVSGNKIVMTHTTANGITGRYELTLTDNRQVASGTSTDSRNASGPVTLIRIPGPNVPTPPPTSGMVLRVESRRVKAGDSTTVPVWLDRAADVANINFELTYQPGVVTTSSVSKGALVPNSMLFEANPRESGIVRIGFAGSKDLSGSGPVAHIPFKAVGKPGDKSPLTLKVTTISRAAGGEPSIQVVHGVVEIVEVEKPWTVNPTAQHALDALKMSVKLIPEKTAADVDTDGKVTSTDARLILQKVVGKAGSP